MRLDPDERTKDVRSYTGRKRHAGNGFEPPRRWLMKRAVGAERLDQDAYVRKVH